MATINSTLKFQDEMSNRMESIARKLDMTATEAKIAKANLDQLENAQRQWKTTLDSLKNAQIQDKDAIAKAREEYLKALKAYDEGVLKVQKYESQMNSLEQQLNRNKKGFESVEGKIVTLSAAFQLFNQVKSMISSVNSKINEFVNYTRTQMQAEDQLAIITKQRMSLTDSEVRSLYDLASAQQKVGVVGDEATLAGMSGLAAFTKQKTAIEALTPAMDDLAVKTFKYNVTAENMDMISKSLGKAMQGDVGALSRMGIKIDDVTKKRLMQLKEEQRAIELAKIIHSVTGDMNKDMANNAFGQMAQAQNALSDSYERLGAILLPLQATVMQAWSSTIQTIINNLDTIVPLMTVALTVVGAGFIALKAQAIGSAIASAAAWIAATAPFWVIIGVIGLVSVALDKLGLNFKQQAENILISINWIITAAQNLIAHFENVGIAIHNAFSKDKWEYKEIKANDLYTNTQKAQSQMDKLNGGLLTGRKLLGSANKGMTFDGLTTNTSGGKALKTQNQGDISLKDDDIALLHDIATRDYAQYFQQLTPNLTIPSMVIHETADVNQVIGAIANAVTGTVSSSTSGGYATA